MQIANKNTYSIGEGVVVVDVSSCATMELVVQKYIQEYCIKKTSIVKQNAKNELRREEKVKT